MLLLNRHLVLIISLFIISNCNHPKCKLPEQYKNLEDFPAEREVIGRYKLKNDSGDYRIVISSDDYVKSFEILGTPPWCQETIASKFIGTWQLLSSEFNHYEQQEYLINFHFKPEDKLGVLSGPFLFKKLDGEICIVLPRRKNDKDCLSHLKSYSASCDFETLVKENKNQK